MCNFADRHVGHPKWAEPASPGLRTMPTRRGCRPGRPSPPPPRPPAPDVPLPLDPHVLGSVWAGARVLVACDLDDERPGLDVLQHGAGDHPLHPAVPPAVPVVAQRLSGGRVREVRSEERGLAHLQHGAAVKEADYRVGHLVGISDFFFFVVGVVGGFGGGGGVVLVLLVVSRRLITAVPARRLCRCRRAPLREARCPRCFTMIWCKE